MKKIYSLNKKFLSCVLCICFIDSGYSSSNNNQFSQDVIRKNRTALKVFDGLIDNSVQNNKFLDDVGKKPTTDINVDGDLQDNISQGFGGDVSGASF